MTTELIPLPQSHGTCPLLVFKAANNNYTAIIRHIPGASNVIADALSRTQMPKCTGTSSSTTTNSTACGSSHHWSPGPAATFFLHESIAASSQCTYNTDVSRYTEFCRQRKWSPFPASESSLVEFVASAASEVQYQMLKVYLASIKHHHQLAGMPDPVATSICLPLSSEASDAAHFGDLQNLAFQSL